MMRLWLALAFALTACQSGSGSGSIRLTWRSVDSVNADLPPGVRVFAGHSSIPPVRAWAVRINEPDPQLVTRVRLSSDAEDGRETLTSFATGDDVCVAVNGGYFAMDRTPSVHAGLLLVENHLVAPATRSVERDAQRYVAARAAIGFTDDDEIEITWATTRGDTLLAWPDPPAHAPGSPAEVDSTLARPWNVRDAVGAGPMLVVDGAVRVTTDEEIFFGSAIPRTHPRTAVGRTADGDLILLVVDGRQPASRGVDLVELATIMRDLGAERALNLDGGGSSALVVRGRLLNRPLGDTTQREVVSALVTYCPGHARRGQDTP